jgi:RHS repeat-associated protein
MLMPGRKFEVGDSYKYGFNGKENDNEVKGEGDQQDYGKRVYDPRLGKFLSVDPLTMKYPQLTPYQFASNTPIQAIDLDGLEAFVIHGTNQGTGPGTDGEGVDFVSNGAINELMRITNNTQFDDKFRWYSPLPPLQNENTREVSARQLLSYIVKTRETMLKNKKITEDEPISLIGYSHGGNVAIQTAGMLGEMGIKVNLVTVSTPAYNSSFNTDSDNPVFGDKEDPQGNKGINRQIHMVHENDGVVTLAGGDRSYSNPGITTNYLITQQQVPIQGLLKGINAHTDLPSHPSLTNFLKGIQSMDYSVPMPKINDLKLSFQEYQKKHPSITKI